MITRRRFLGTAASTIALSRFASAKTLFGLGIPPSVPDLTKFVKIAIGTGGHGHTYPGATVPFGMVQLSPDTYNDGWDWCSGYHRSDTSIMGFSHTHLSGTGGADLLDVLLMPGTGAPKINPGSREKPEEGYRSRFSHEHEVATPGFYSVMLDDYGILAEMTASERVGLHRYTFTKKNDNSSHFIIDLAHRYGSPDVTQNNDKQNTVLWSEMKIAGPAKDTITGGRSTDIWAKGRQIYFAMQFSRPFDSAQLLSDDPLDANAQEAKGRALKCIVHMPTSEGEMVLVKCALSSVSAEKALTNLQAEMPEWEFDRVRSAAAGAWQRELGRIQIETPNQKHKEIFYTGLYHAMLAPALFDDADGQYRGMDGEIHNSPKGEHNYTTYSLWDTYRALHPLYTIMLPERVPDFVNNLVRMAHESPAGLPIWPLHGRETFCMTGYHSVAVIAEAVQKGFPGIDARFAYAPMKQRAFVDDYEGLALYRKNGYIAADLLGESTSKTMDYCYDDWAIAHVARAAGATEDYRKLLKRSTNYRNLFDGKTNFIRPKLASGEWAEPFDPRGMGHSKKWRDFTESNAWQGTFANQHDLHAYIEMFGGREAFVEKLDGLFNASSELPPDSPPDIAGLVGQYAHGNEPSHHIAYLYAYAGAPWKTQERVRQLLETMYDNQPDGLAGNEDCGQMSAWYILSALGFYAVDPVSANYVIGTPLFDRAVVQVGNGKALVIEAKRKSPEDKYIQSVMLNGKAHEKVWFRHTDIASGGTLIFTMGGTANKRWGADPGAAPPSAAESNGEG